MGTRAFRRWAFLASLPLVGACAAPQIESQQSLGHVGHMGTVICPADEGLKILQVAPRSAAEKAGIKEGDILTGYRGLDLARPENRLELLWDIRNGEGKLLELTLKRGGTSLTLKAAPTRKELYPQDELSSALRDEVETGRKVSVAIVVTLINHAAPELFKNAPALEAWKAGMKDSTGNLFEGLLLNKGLMRCGNYSVADRDKTKQVLEELHFQMSGAVSPETTRQLGKLVGASHLLFVSLTRFRQASGSYEDVITTRLVAVETGTVAASVRFRQTVQAK